MARRMIEILVPKAETGPAETRGACRVGDLNGKVIGILDNRWPNYAVFLRRTEQLLSERYPACRIIKRTKPLKGVPAASALLDELASRCDVVINGLGG
ncbi:MAG: hypothetical protein HYX92_11230 [Chloroflexi bacterium]|nr:hypothetical protein [Chloroflexota bacterium]